MNNPATIEIEFDDCKTAGFVRLQPIDRQTVWVRLSAVIAVHLELPRSDNIAGWVEIHGKSSALAIDAEQLTQLKTALGLE